MVYRLVWHESAIKDLIGLDKMVAKRIFSKLNSHLVKSPETIGSLLTGDYKGFYKYRVGDWRAVYYFDKTEKVIKVLKVGHRRDVYSGDVPLG